MIEYHNHVGLIYSSNLDTRRDYVMDYFLFEKIHNKDRQYQLYNIGKIENAAT